MTPADCPECGATCTPEETSCWMCHRRLRDAKQAAPAPAPKLEPPPPPLNAPQDLEKTAPAINVTMILVAVGAFFMGGPLGILIAFMMIPAFITNAASPKPVPGQKPAAPATFWDHVLGAVKILAATAAVLVLVSIGIIVAFWATCMFILKAAGSH